MLRCSTLLLALLAVAAVSVAGEGNASPVIVVHPDNPVDRLSVDALQRIYLGRKTLWEEWEDGQRIQPALPGERTDAARAFIEGTLGKTLDQYTRYWRRRLFSGGGKSPATYSSASELIDFVRRNPGAIAVLDAAAAPDGVKAVIVGN